MLTIIFPLVCAQALYYYSEGGVVLDVKRPVENFQFLDKNATI